MQFKSVAFFLLLFFQNGLCFLNQCKEYFEGFHLQDGYNKNTPPGENVTIFDLQHIRDIVKVRWIWFEHGSKSTWAPHWKKSREKIKDFVDENVRCLGLIKSGEQCARSRSNGKCYCKIHQKTSSLFCVWGGSMFSKHRCSLSWWYRYATLALCDQ